MYPRQLSLCAKHSEAATETENPGPLHEVGHTKGFQHNQLELPSRGPQCFGFWATMEGMDLDAFWHGLLKSHDKWAIRGEFQSQERGASR
jgi:hypothetical protein